MNVHPGAKQQLTQTGQRKGKSSKDIARNTSSPQGDKTKFLLLSPGSEDIPISDSESCQKRAGGLSVQRDSGLYREFTWTVANKLILVKQSKLKLKSELKF